MLSQILTMSPFNHYRDYSSLNKTTLANSTSQMKFKKCMYNEHNKLFWKSTVLDN